MPTHSNLTDRPEVSITNQVVLYSEADLPDPVAGEITLVAGTRYYVAKSFTMSNVLRFPTASGIVFYFQDVNYSIILAILIGLSVLIPYVGAILVTIPVVIIGLFQWGLETSFYIYILSYLLIQALDGNVLMPLLLGREVKLHPVYIITAV